MSDLESQNPIKFWNAKTLKSNSEGRMLPAPISQMLQWWFPPWFSIMATIVPDNWTKCQNSGLFSGKNDCTLIKITPQNGISFRYVSSCGTIENCLMFFKERHLLDENHVDGIFNPQPRGRDTHHISPRYKILELIVIFQVS